MLPIHSGCAISDISDIPSDTFVTYAEELGTGHGSAGLTPPGDLPLPRTSRSTLRAVELCRLRGSCHVYFVH